MPRCVGPRDAVHNARRLAARRLGGRARRVVPPLLPNRGDRGARPIRTAHGEAAMSADGEAEAGASSSKAAMTAAWEPPRSSLLASSNAVACMESLFARSAPAHNNNSTISASAFFTAA
mmetsp:Transcript_4456/g.10052  ORF Transcript_4456/g.10052 Transcript_4456/m.10052 type:complete len:119 (+) Transcript_4456:477-833(+)